MIVDTHVHVTCADRSLHPALEGAPDWPVTEIDPLIADMDRVGIDRAVLVQTLFTYGFDNSYMIACAHRYPKRLKAVCVIDQLRADAPRTLAQLVEEQGVAGVRLMPKGQPEGVLRDPRTFPVWEEAARLGVPVTIAAEQEHLRDLGAVIERFPTVPVCLEHMWALDLRDDFEARIVPMLAFARHANVHLKLAPNNSKAIRAAAIEPRDFFGRLAEVFGVQRLLWGSNYPAHTAAFGPLSDRLRIMQDDLAFLDDAGREAFFGGNALRLCTRPVTTALRGLLESAENSAYGQL